MENVNKSKDMILKARKENCSRKVNQKLHGTGNEYVNMLVLKVVEKYILVDCPVVTTDSKNWKFKRIFCKLAVFEWKKEGQDN
jgi:hypothetical protein